LQFFLGPLNTSDGAAGDGSGRPHVKTDNAAAGSPLAVCLLAVEALRMSGGGISVITPAGHRGMVCATDDVAAAIEELQFSLGEGPCVDAFHRGPVLIDDLGDPSHLAASPWPEFTMQAAAAGACALFALPLQIGAIRVGAFDLYRNFPGPLTDDQLSVALTFADAAAGSLLGEDGHAVPFPRDPKGSAFHAEVHQATGMISAQLEVSLEDAFVQLRARAFANEWSVNDVAREVVAGRLRFGEDDGG
jgi:hypothetical protein